MWLSECLRSGGGQSAPAAEVGQVSLAGGTVAVVTQNEQRELRMALPGGFSWRPKTGQRVLVLHSGEGESIVVGVLPETENTETPGAVELAGEGCVLRLGADGTVTLSGSRISLTGPLYINGELYEKCSCAEV